MAGKGGATPSTYSPSPTTHKTKSLSFGNDDVLRPDDREWHQCRPACDLPVVISCASLALADAGIMMYDLVTSVSVSYLGKNLVLDPTLEEESHQDGSLILTCMPSRDEVTQLTITGEWSTPKINKGMKICMDACSKFSQIMKSCLKGLDSALEEEDSNVD
ncbi:hypothetical protein PRUPE_6G104100 [Prunus persica]|uniref:Exoribonuclease phosphorolytic domain-containing protein n=1 Tax=Prunus persica TaxID=3760 RepID=A0A251NN90_PRUPE|nr:hypothetical protein PRUPE_6G104100 [Prunus persica]